MIIDASSTYIVIKSKELRSLRDSSTLDLAFYEIGNAILQEERIGIIDAKASLALSEVVQSLPEIMHVTPFQSLNAEKVHGVAEKLGLTFYDAAYISDARNCNEPLVTDDGKLAKAASKIGVRTYSAADYLKSQS